MKKLLTCSLLLLFGLITQIHAQESDWKLLKEADGIRVEYQVRDYAPKHSQFYVLRVKNTNAHDVSIGWDYRLEYNNGQEVYNPKSSEYHVGLVLKAGQHLEGQLPRVDDDAPLLNLHYRYTGQYGEVAKIALTGITLEHFKVFTL